MASTATRTRKKASTKRKTTAKKSTVRSKKAKPITKKRTAVAKTVTRKLATTAIRTAYKKTTLVNELAELNNMSKKEVNEFFESLSNLMGRHLKKGAAGEFTLPGVLKVVKKVKPATKKRKGINPFTGEEMVFKAKPARNVVKIRPLKGLKEMVE